MIKLYCLFKPLSFGIICYSENGNDMRWGVAGGWVLIKRMVRKGLSAKQRPEWSGEWAMWIWERAFKVKRRAHAKVLWQECACGSDQHGWRENGRKWGQKDGTGCCRLWSTTYGNWAENNMVWSEPKFKMVTLDAVQKIVVNRLSKKVGVYQLGGYPCHSGEWWMVARLGYWRRWEVVRLWIPSR